MLRVPLRRSPSPKELQEQLQNEVDAAFVGDGGQVTRAVEHGEGLHVGGRHAGPVEVPSAWGLAEVDQRTPDGGVGSFSTS